MTEPHSLTITNSTGNGLGTEVLLDGAPVRGLTHVELALDVNDVNRASLRLQVLSVDSEVVGDLRWEVSLLGGRDPGEDPLYGFGATVSEALRDLAVAVEREERK